MRYENRIRSSDIDSHIKQTNVAHAKSSKEITAHTVKIFQNCNLIESNAGKYF